MVQRVLKAQVFANLKQIGSIGQGAVALLGINNQDTREKIPCLVKKLSQLRMFPNAEGKMDLSLVDLKLELLIISQYSNFLQAASLDIAKPL